MMADKHGDAISAIILLEDLIIMVSFLSLCLFSSILLHTSVMEFLLQACFLRIGQMTASYLLLCQRASS